MHAARAGHTATVLLDGRVLVVNGHDALSQHVDFAEIYDPTGGVWRKAGDVVTPRIEGTATRLADGRVLLAGGMTGIKTHTTATAEVFDPASGHFSGTGQLLTARTGHTATLLSNGRVLAAGGFTDGAGSAFAVTSSVELFDPATGTWIPTDPMEVPRVGHATSLLPDGRVLVTGGVSAPDPDDPEHLLVPLATAEIYDPPTGVWTSAPAMLAIHEDHAAVALADGRVLVVAGWTRDSNGTAVPSQRNEIFDSSARKWNGAASLHTARVDSFTVTVLADGQVLVVGGRAIASTSGSEIVTDVEAYNPGVASWSIQSPPSVPRADHTASLLPDGRVLVAGGAVNSRSVRATESCEIYDQ